MNTFEGLPLKEEIAKVYTYLQKEDVIKIKPEKTLLIIVDMQNDFVKPEGKLYTGLMIHSVTGKIKNLLYKCRSSGVRVIFTQSWYEANDPRFSTHPKASKKEGGCMANSWGAEIIAELSPVENETIIKKSSYDPFFGTNFDRLLRNLGCTFDYHSVHRNRLANDWTAIVTGTVANICVYRTVSGLYLRGFEVVVPKDCIAAKSALDLAIALRDFAEIYDAKITTSELIIFG